MENTYNKTYEVVFDSCLETLKQEEFTIDIVKRPEGLIEARIYKNKFTYPIDVIVRVEEVDSTNTRVKVSARRFPQLITFGVNKATVKRLGQAIEKKLQQ